MRLTSDVSWSFTTAPLPLSISTSSLDDGYQGRIYNRRLSATGGITPYSWSIISGSLPDGLALNSVTGVITGKPNTTGCSTVTFQVRDASNTTASKTITLNVKTPFEIKTTTLADGYAATTYSQTLEAAGGQVPYSWSIASGSLPTGIILDSATGTISGTMPSTIGNSNVTIQVKDGNNSVVTKSFSISTLPLPQIQTNALPDGYVSIAFSQPIATSGGKMPYTYSLASGALPEGLTLSDSGVISGVPTTAGISTLTVQVTDANNKADIKSLTVNIHSTLVITSDNTHDGYAGFAYNQTLLANGGKPPFTWSVTDGALPEGLILSSEGIISGTPSLLGTSVFTVQVKDANNQTATKSFTIILTELGSISGTVTDMEHGTPLQGVTVTLNLSGITSKDPSDMLYSCYFSNLSASDYETVTTDDGARFRCTSPGGDYQYMTFRVRAPYGSNDSLTVRWVGTSVFSDDEYLAQAFVPTRSGSLTKVMFMDTGKSYNWNTGELIYVQLRSALDGGAENVLAESELKYISLITLHFCQDEFNFPIPVTLAAGQQYYLVIKGHYVDPPYFKHIYWTNGPAQANTPAFVRNNGIWNRIDSSLVFKTYIDDQPDVSGPAMGEPPYLRMVGDSQHILGISALNRTTGSREYGGTLIASSEGDAYPDGNYFIFTKGDSFLTIEKTVPAGATGYYDQNGWVEFIVENLSSPNGSLLTDQFSIAFSRTLTAISDANGFYTFPSLPDGNYTLTFEKPAYATTSENGALTPGHNINRNTGLVKLTPASLQGNITLSDNRLLAGVVVKVTDAVGTKSCVSDSQGNYIVNGIIPGNYTITFEGLGLTTRSESGVLSPGQTGVVSVVMSLATVTLNIVSPADGVLITSSPLTVTGTAQNADNVTVNITINGVVTIHSAAIINDSFAIAVPLSAGPVRIVAVASNQYGQSAEKSMTITFDPSGTIHGTVTDASNGLPISSVNVTVTDAVGIVYDASTDTDGRFNITGLSPGPASGKISKEGYLPHSFSRTIGQGEIVSMEISLATFAVRNLGDTGNVTVMEAAGTYDAKQTDGSINDQPRQAVAKEYFKSHGDLDFLVILSTFDYALPETDAQGFYLEVQNDIQGINRPVFDNSGSFGSPGRLQGTIDMGNVSSLAANPYGPKLDTTLTTLNHELMHRFGAYVRFMNPDNTLNTGLIGRDSAHWSYLLDGKGSLMYGNGWKDNGDGSFTSITAMSGFSPLDLYLMGMIPKEQVPPMLLIENPAIDKNQLPQPGATVTGTSRTVTIDEIIAAEGARIPDSTASQKKFKLGFVLLVRPGDDPSAALPAIETLRTAFAGRFAELTDGKGGIEDVPPILNVYIESPADGATITGPDVTVTGAFVNSTGAETGITVNGMPATVSGSRFIVNRVPLQEGQNTIAVTATDVNGLTATATRTVTSQPGHFLRIIPNVEAGAAPVDVYLRLDGSFIVSNPSISISGPVPVTLAQGSIPTEYTANLMVEGAYIVIASAEGPDGVTYTDSVMISVQSKSQLESLLRTRWENMRQAVFAGNIETALSHFVQSARGRFGLIFTDPSRRISARLTEINRIELFTATGKAAQAGAIRAESGGEYAYPLNFVKDERGVWKILGF